MREEKKVSVLVVENERIIAKDIESVLKRYGYEIAGLAFSGRDAVELARSVDPDVLLMDIKLGEGMDGIETAREISQFCDAAVIFITAYADNSTLERVKTVHSYGYVIKPIDEKSLQVSIEMAVHKNWMEKQLREKDKWLKMIIENLDEGLVAIDKSGRIQMINPVAEQITGWKNKNAMGKPQEEVLLLMDGYDFTPVRAPFYKAMEEKTLVFLRENCAVKSLEGKTVNIDGKCIPVIDDVGTISGAMLLFQDITRRKQLENRLRQAQKMESLGTLAGGIAHDFNNILAVILGSTQLAQRKIQEGIDIQQHIDHIMIAGTRAKELVKQILAFSRQHEEKKRPIQIGPIVREVLKLLSASLPSNIRIITDIEESHSLAMADPTQIHQVMINLCANAAHAMKEKGGTLTVSLKDVYITPGMPENDEGLKEGPYICLSVDDTGHGIDSSILPLIFDPYFTTKEPDEGTGMGLAVIHTILQSHNAQILVRSKPGKGSSFRIFFPRVETDSAGDPGSLNHVTGGNERILYIDDNPLLVDLGREMLEPLGYSIVGRTNALKALEDFRENPHQFDLVITDLSIPPMTGLQFTKKLLKIRPDIPIILTAGFSDETTREEAKAAGIGEIVMKPIVFKDIAEIIRRLLDKNN